jgi:hypothetical protein
MRRFWRDFPLYDVEQIAVLMAEHERNRDSSQRLYEDITRIGKMGSLNPRFDVAFIAQSAAVVAQKGPLCARRELLAELDASRSWREACNDFLSIFRVRGLSRTDGELRDASVSAAVRSGDIGTSSSTARGAKNYAQKRNERTLMRYRAGCVLKTYRRENGQVASS